MLHYLRLLANYLIDCSYDCILITENDHECGINTGLNPYPGCWLFPHVFFVFFKYIFIVKIDKMLVESQFV